MIAHTRASLRYYAFETFAELRHGVFTRLGGMSQAHLHSLNLGGNVGDEEGAVAENYRRLFASLDLQVERACSVWQVHSKDCIVVDQPAEGRPWIARADGMVTAHPNTPLVMRFADCTPLFFYDPIQRVIGIAHAGWRGTVQGIGGQMIRLMVETYGCVPHQIRAAIGPSIGPDHYQVGDEVVEAVRAHFGTLEGLVSYDAWDYSAYLNLWAANELDLRRNGVNHVEVAGICTACHTDEFYSHRAEQGKTGRFAGVISL